MATVQGPQDLQAYIEDQGITAELIGGLGDTPTVPAANGTWPGTFRGRGFSTSKAC